MNSVIEMPVSELKTALTGLGKVVKRSSSLPVLQSIRITRDKSNIVTLQATDLDAAVIYQAQTVEPGPVCDFLIPFDPLNKAIKGNVDAVQLVVEAKGKVRLKTFIGSGPIEQTLESVAVDEYPPIPKIEGESTAVDADFRDSLRQALECRGNDYTRQILGNACVDVRDPKAHYVVGTNGRHLFCANSFALTLKESVLIPDQRFLHWSGFMDSGIGQLSVKAKTKKDCAWLQINSGPWKFIARQLEGVYPNWKNALPAPNSSRTRIELGTVAMQTLIAGIPKLPGADDINSPVTMEVSSDRIQIKGRPKAGGEWSVLNVENATINGKPVTILINREYLLRAVRFGLNTVEIEDADSPLEFRNGGKRMIVCPLKPEVTAAPKAAQSTPAEPAGTTTTPPPSANDEAQPQETMPKTTEAETPAAAESPLKQVMLQIDTIKESLKQVVRDLAQTLEALKQAEKDKKTNDKEVEAVRAKLREIQSVKI